MSQFHVICFDIANKRRLRKVAIQMENFGNRIQYSVFECHLNNEDLSTLKGRLEKIVNPEEDNIRYYRLCNKDQQKIHLDGTGRITPKPEFHLL